MEECCLSIQKESEAFNAEKPGQSNSICYPRCLLPRKAMKSAFISIRMSIISAEELSELKTLNDWNKELDLSRCQKEQNIYDIRDNKRHNIEATDQIRTVKAEFETQYSVELKAYPFEQNDSGSVIVSMCEFGDQPWNGCLLIVMINADGSYAFKDNASGDLDYFNYQDALMQLKEECNWDR